jgi:hypothetical protein
MELLIARKFVDEDDADKGLTSVSSPSLALLLAGDGSPEEGMDTDCLMDLLKDESCVHMMLDTLCANSACSHANNWPMFPCVKWTVCCTNDRNFFDWRL